MDVKISRILNRGTDDERLVLKVLRNCNMNEYVVFDTTFDENGVVSNKHRHLYVFPQIDVKANDTVVLYTKRGTYSTIYNDNGTTSYFFYCAFILKQFIKIIMFPLLFIVELH